MAGSDRTDVSLEEARRLIVRVGKDARSYGAAAPRIADYLHRLAHSFGLRSGTLTWPHHMLFVVQDPQERRQQVDVEQVPPGGMALDKLASVGTVVDAVVAGDHSAEQAMAALDEIERSPPPWDRWAVAVSYAIVGPGIAILLDGTWLDAALGAALAVVVYGMVLVAGRLGSRWAGWVPLLTTFVPAAVAASVRSWRPEVSVIVVTISAIAILLPGYAVSIGIGELVEDHIIAGWSNLLSGLVYLAKQVLGGWLGIAVVRPLFDAPPAPTPSPIPGAWLWLFMPLLLLGLAVVLQTARQDVAWVFLCCGLAFGTALLAENIWNADLGTLIAAAITAVYSNLWAARSKRPTSIVLLPAVIVLVSGSVGFQGLAALAEGDTTVGAEQFVQMFVVAVMVTAGLLVGNTIVRPRNTL